MKHIYASWIDIISGFGLHNGANRAVNAGCDPRQSILLNNAQSLCVGPISQKSLIPKSARLRKLVGILIS